MDQYQEEDEEEEEGQEERGILYLFIFSSDPPSLFLLQEPKKVKSEGIKAERLLEELMKRETP